MNKEEVNILFDNLKNAFPVELVERIHSSSKGYECILGYLNKNGVATAGELAKITNVSTARIAVLIDKLINKGFVTKKSDISDKRISVIEITEAGRNEAVNISNHCLCEINNLVEKIGIDDLNKLIEILSKIRNITKEEI